MAAFTPEPFALALGMSPSAGAQLIADALDLRHRLPMLWKRVSRLEVPAWQARRVARQTHRLSKAAAIWVDEQLADRGSCGPVVVDRLVAHAIAAYDPETHEDRENDAQAGWDVTLTHPDATDFLGTSHLEATGDTLVLKAFYDQVCGIAHQLFLDGDTSPLGVRKIKALGILTGQPAATGKPKIKAYVRVDAPTSRSTARAAPPWLPVRSRSSAPPPSPRSATWVGHHQVVIQPVLNMARRDAVDSHDPPGWMRDLVHLRDGHCIFPRCQVDARSCDLDHFDPLRRERTTRPNPGRESRLPLPATPPRQDHRSLAVPPHARRRLPLARPVRHDLPRHALTRPRRRPVAFARSSAKTHNGQPYTATGTYVRLPRDGGSLVGSVSIAAVGWPSSDKVP